MLRYLVLVIIAFCIVACSKSDPVTPVSPDQDHSAQWFYNPIQLFGDVNVNSDADVSEIVISLGGTPQPGGTQGTVWAHGGSHWSVVTTRVETQQGNHIGYYKFLGEGVSGDWVSPGIPFGLPGRDIAFPKVAAAYFTHPAHQVNDRYTFVEVAIVFMLRNEADTQWDLAVQILRFDPDDFVVGDLDQIEPLGPVLVLVLDDDFNCMYPDVAYYPERGHIIIVYSRDDLPGSRFVYYRMGLRDDPYDTINWIELEWRAQNPYHNGFHPRIDIGWIKLFGEELQWMVGLVYTGAHDDRWRPWYNYWPAASLGPQTYYNHEIPFPDPVYLEHGGGLPVVDIGPPGSNFAAAVWTQAKNPLFPEDWETVSVAYMDILGCYTLLSPENSQELSSYPSISIHDNDFDDPISSISYLHKDNPNDHWWPSMRYFQPDPPDVNPGPRDYWNFEIYGDWQAMDSISRWYGMSTSLIVYPDDSYWFTWTSKIPGDAEPCRIHGSFGFTE